MSIQFVENSFLSGNVMLFIILIIILRERICPVLHSKKVNKHRSKLNSLKVNLYFPDLVIRVIIRLDVSLT